jgi:hypothetical protein
MPDIFTELSKVKSYGLYNGIKLFEHVIIEVLQTLVNSMAC